MLAHTLFVSASPTQGVQTVISWNTRQLWLPAGEYLLTHRLPSISQWSAVRTAKIGPDVAGASNSSRRSYEIGWGWIRLPRFGRTRSLKTHDDLRVAWECIATHRLCETTADTKFLFASIFPTITYKLHDLLSREGRGEPANRAKQAKLLWMAPNGRGVSRLIWLRKAIAEYHSGNPSVSPLPSRERG